MNRSKPFTAFRILFLGLLLASFAISTSRGFDDPNQRYLPPVQVASWQLGVSVKNLRGGCGITRVLPLSSAKQAGLEQGDIILSVNGVPVGYTGAVLNDLEDELNRQADALGRVTLRIRNGRNGTLATVPVRLTPANQWQPPVAPPWWDVPVQPKIVRPPWYDPQLPQRPIQPPIVVDPVRANIDALYLRYFGRRPDAVGMQNWLTQISKGMRMEEVHANLLASAEFYDRCQNNEQEWIAQLYLLLAGRRGTGAEIQHWERALAREYQGQRLPLSRDFLKALGQY